jgi:hypothetical protein
MYDYAENEDVIFDLLETTNPNKDNALFYFATNIRPASEVF